MLNAFSNNQKGGVSPQFAFIASAFFIVIGGSLYLQGDAAYVLFDTMIKEVRYAV